jgi:hypothetical protein
MNRGRQKTLSQGHNRGRLDARAPWTVEDMKHDV